MTDIQRQVTELKKLVHVDTANYFLTKMQKIQNIKDSLFDNGKIVSIYRRYRSLLTE